MADKKSMKEHSKIDYISTKEKATENEILVGAVQRIADATELMAQDQAKLKRDLAFYKERFNWYRDECNRLYRSSASLRRWITRLKKQING